MLQLVDLFSGIGGFSLALKDVAATIMYCESNPRCRDVLAARMADGTIDRAQLHNDVTLLTAQDLKPCSQVMISAGFPCQDISSANMRGAGVAGPRSGIVSHVFRLIDSIGSVDCVLLENSPMIMRKGGEEVVAALTKRGFAVAYGCFSAQEVGAPQKRKRWFCLAKKPDVSLPKITSGTRWPARKEPLRVAKRCGKVQTERREMLGNAVVPAVVRTAYNSLLDAICGALDASGPGREVQVVHGQQQHTVFRPEGLKKNTVVLELEFVERTVVCTGWATPTVCYPRPYRTLTPRGPKMFVTQVLYDKATLSQVNNTLSMPVSREELLSEWCVHPEFVEWLMGFPSRYTRVSWKREARDRLGNSDCTERRSQIATADQA